MNPVTPATLNLVILTPLEETRDLARQLLSTGTRETLTTIGMNNMNRFKKFVTAAAAGLALGLSGTTHADTATATGAAAGSGGAGAQVDLQFRIIIPQFIFFRVGSTGTTVDRIQFDPTTADVTTPGAVTNATSGGDVSPGVVTVSLISNAGAVTISETNDGGGSGLSNGSGDFISYAQINSSGTGTIAPPPLSDAGTGSTPVPTTAGAVTVASDQWTYTYTNPATPPAPGTYDGTVFYTAAIP